MPFLVYERTVGNRIIATIWMEHIRYSHNSKDYPHIWKKEITENEVTYGIERLKKMYPLPEKLTDNG